ncbi:MAG: T9SS type A sorting domain-containing protein, partial [Balneolales bacterium]|nr:T9SS type A sorting domain-containing protein [Balneolales bacterium]
GHAQNTAELQKNESPSYTGNAELQKNQSASYTGNAELHKNQSTSYTGNTELQKNQSTVSTLENQNTTYVHNHKNSTQNRNTNVAHNSDNTYHLRLCGEWTGNQIPLSLTGSIEGYIRINSITSDQDAFSYLDEPLILASENEILLDLESNQSCFTLELNAFPGESPTGTSQSEQSELPAEVVLHQNFPNPFNPSTVISFDIPEQSHVELTVFTVLGQRVITLQQGYLSAGSHTLQFDAARLSSGVYVIQLNVDGRRFSRSMTLLK